MSIRTIGSTPGQAATPPAPAPAETTSSPPAKTPAPAAVAAEATPEQVKSAVAEIQKTVRMSTGNLRFSVDDETGKTVVSVVDKESGELIRQIPSAELMEIAKSIGRMQGLLVNRKA